MVLCLGNYLTLGLFTALLLLIFQVYRNYRKNIGSFPYYNVFAYVVYCQVTGKVTKRTPFNNVIFEKLIQVGKQYAKEGFFMTYLLRPTLFIYNQEAIKVFANETAALDKSPEYDIVADIVGNGIGTSGGEIWKTKKKMINPAFQMEMLKEKIPIFNDHAIELAKDLKKYVSKSFVDIMGALKLHYFNCQSESLMGLKRSKENKEQILKFAENMDTLGEMAAQRMIYPWLRPKVLLKFSSFGRKFLEQNKESDDFINNVVLDMKECMYSPENENTCRFRKDLRKTLTYILLNHHLKDLEAFTFEDLHDEVKSILIAGYDSVTYTTMWCLFLLGLHPEIQEKVFDEIQSFTSEYITYEELANLTYLEAVIMESLRIYPTTPFFGRHLSKDVQLGKHKVFSGTSIIFATFLMHRDPKIYPNPEKFEPERFLNVDLKNRWNFTPFSVGTRDCIGQNFAIMELKIFFAHILRNFKIISLDRREDVKLCWALVLSPVERLHFKIMQRQ